MKGIFTIMLAAIVCCSEIRGEEIQIEDGYVRVEIIDHLDWEGVRFWYVIDGSKFRTGAEAAKALEYIYANWPDNKPPTLVYESTTKAGPEGEDVLFKAVIALSKLENIRVILMPIARNSIPRNSITVARLLKEHAKPPVSAQPATKPAEKPPVKGQPPTPTSKGGPR